MPVALESLDASLNATTLDRLGDSVTYTPLGAAAKTVKALVDHDDAERDFGGSRAVADDPAIEVAKTDIPVVDPGDVIRLPRTGLDYKPKGAARTDSTGLNWLIQLKRKV